LIQSPGQFSVILEPQDFSLFRSRVEFDDGSLRAAMESLSKWCHML